MQILAEILEHELYLAISRKDRGFTGFILGLIDGHFEAIEHIFAVGFDVNCSGLSYNGC